MFGFLSAYFFSQPFFQTASFILSMEFYLIYVGIVLPQENVAENVLEYFNESLSVILSYHLLLFTDLIINKSNQPESQSMDSELVLIQREKIGLSFCVFLAFLLIVNFGLVLNSVVSKGVIWPLKRYYKIIKNKIHKDKVL